MDTKRFLTVIAGLLLLAVGIAYAGSAYGITYTDYAHSAVRVADGKNTNLSGTTIGNGQLADVTCIQNCTGFGSGGISYPVDASQIQSNTTSMYPGMTWWNTINTGTLHTQFLNTASQVWFDWNNTGGYASFRDNAGLNRVWTDFYHPASTGSSGANGSYSVYIDNMSGTYNTYNSTGTLIYTSSSGWDVLNWSVNTSSAKVIFLKAGTNITNIPTLKYGAGAGGTNLPPNLTIIGEDWNIISVVVPATNFIGLGSGGTVEHVRIQSAFNGDLQGAGTARQIQYLHNSRPSSANAFSNWRNQFMGAYIGEPGLDIPGLGILNYGAGDTFYAQLSNTQLNDEQADTGGGVGFRCDDSSGVYNHALAGCIEIYDLNSTSSAAGQRVYFRVTDGTLGSSHPLYEFSNKNMTLNTTITFGPSGGINQSSWTACSFQNSWADYGGGQTTCAFLKDSMGFVHIKGNIASGTVGNIPAFNLPIGYRPTQNMVLLVQSPLSGASAGSVQIYSNGQFDVEVANNAFVSIDGITFYTL